ncbi:UNKNOWN [Stylonychia lemnae]|uniref:Transmembrane protein n=1 Tax=Stylonychia lemnae TaxID=5949 RepID=A0A078B9D0_STYLE|nr:UNKNOWN [Stylonychia lemnae]|eukprot:CDW90178.1 UNKNOWN [Stylonychia lemnae]
MDQTLYMILRNQNHNLYNNVRSFARTYNALQKDIIDKTYYTETLTYACISLILGQQKKSKTRKSKSNFVTNKHAHKFSQQNKQNSQNDADDLENDQVKKEEIELEDSFKNDRSEQKQRRRMIKQKIQFQLRKKLMKYLISISVSAFLVCGYFLAFHFLSTQTFLNISGEIDVIKAAFSRVTSKDNMLFGILDAYINNKTILINGFQEQINYYNRRGYEEEQDYQTQLFQKQNPQVPDSMKLYEVYDQKDFCSKAFQRKVVVNDSFSVSVDYCQTAGKGALQNGILAYFYQMLQKYQQIQLFFNATKRTEDVIKQTIGSKDFTTLTDLNLRIVQQAWADLELKTYNEVKNFNEQEKTKYIILFSFFVAIIITVLILFFTKMLNSNKMLYLMNYEALDEQHRNNIEIFLKKY